MKTIRELLTGIPPLTMKGSSSTLEACRAMKEAHCGAILVLNEKGRPHGIFTERDLMTRVVVPGLAPDAVKLADVMTPDVFTCSPERRVNDMAREMQARHIRHLPVVEDGNVLGVLSLRDLLREHLETKRHEVRALHAYIQGEEPHAQAEGES